MLESDFEACPRRYETNSTHDTVKCGLGGVGKHKSSSKGRRALHNILTSVHRSKNTSLSDMWLLWLLQMTDLERGLPAETVGAQGLCEVATYVAGRVSFFLGLGEKGNNSSI